MLDKKLATCMYIISIHCNDYVLLMMYLCILLRVWVCVHMCVRVDL